MSELPEYYRDIWCCGPSNNGYPGAFPRGLINKIRRHWWGENRLWLFSGSYRPEKGLFDKDTTVDIKPELEPDIVANCEMLPFKDNSFDFVMADPPYSEQESRDLYGLPYASMIKVLNEMRRVCKPGGYNLFLHRLVPMIHPDFKIKFTTKDIRGIVGVFTIAAMSNIRALTVWQKPKIVSVEEEGEN